MIFSAPDVETAGAICSIPAELTLGVGAELNKHTLDALPGCWYGKPGLLHCSCKSVCPSATKTPVPPEGCRELIDLHGLAVGDLLQHELSNTVTDFDTIS